VAPQEFPGEGRDNSVKLEDEGRLHNQKEKKKYMERAGDLKMA